MSTRYFDEAIQAPSIPAETKSALISVFDTADFARRWLDDNKMERDPAFIAKMTELVFIKQREIEENEMF